MNFKTLPSKQAYVWHAISGQWITNPLNKDCEEYCTINGIPHVRVRTNGIASEWKEAILPTIKLVDWGV